MSEIVNVATTTTKAVESAGGVNGVIAAISGVAVTGLALFPFIRKIIIDQIVKALNNFLKTEQKNILADILDKIENRIRETEIDEKVEGADGIKYKKDVTSNQQIKNIFSEVKDAVDFEADYDFKTKKTGAKIKFKF